MLRNAVGPKAHRTLLAVGSSRKESDGMPSGGPGTPALRALPSRATPSPALPRQKAGLMMRCQHDGTWEGRGIGCIRPRRSAEPRPIEVRRELHRATVYASHHDGSAVLVERHLRGPARMASVRSTICCCARGHRRRGDGMPSRHCSHVQWTRTGLLRRPRPAR